MSDKMKNISFYLVTDTHYFEPSLGASGAAFNEYMKREQYFMAESSDIVKKVFADMAADKSVDTVIIPGDLSKNGEIESHKSFIKELDKLKASGKKIFVITAGHDYNGHSRAFVNDEQIEVEGTPFEQLYDLYYDFGFSQALAVDKRTLSYVAEVAQGVRMLAINCDSEGRKKGTIDDEMYEWMQAQLDDANKANCSVFAICHYPVIPPVPVFDLVGDARLRDWRKVAAFLADNGVELVLTGHMHIQSINEFVSEKGNKLIDVCTSCATGSPAKYRKISIEDSVMKVESLDISYVGDTNGLSSKEFFDNQFRYSIKNRINGALSGGKGFAKIGKKLGRKIVNSITVGGLGRLLFVKVDKSLKKKKFIDLAGDIGVGIFAGDGVYVEGTPVHDAFSKALKRLGFILKKVEPKLSKNGVEVNLNDMLLNTIGNNKGYSDNNAEIKLGR